MFLASVREKIRTQPWARTPGARDRYHRLVAQRIRLVLPVVRRLQLDRLPPEVATQLAYQAYLERDADLIGLETYVPGLISGALTFSEMLQHLRGSSEFETRPAFAHASCIQPSIHVGRCQFIRALPRAAHIVDLGGVSLGDPRGALVGAGYPYAFESLVIVDLPSDERHEIYRSDEQSDIPTASGPVTYRYHSMVDLSSIESDSTDLVYSGQSIEHVTVEDARRVLAEVFRILRPGGHLALDTPNGRVTRLQQDDFIDPDHEVEYTWPELQELLGDAGFHLEWAKGINYAGRSVASGEFDLEDTAANRGLYDEVDSCYILAAVASKP